MSDDLGIPKKFFIQIFDGFLCIFKELLLFLISYLIKLVQPIRCAYIDHVT